ncbi:VOC family protein [Lacrimispora algidixylanolytica]|uniref:VOC domain-containing protein n=1 Tax=Lacrimispora algidixylanolytica TaxID=94868 RepID=A0A419T3I4_9FIRM|nr:VOC family protein [Lacrimispora algidixylanolytica]RKD32117.1 hypothetical protein BET01_17645 [Lacrimispora algidixylanolytica]
MLKNKPSGIAHVAIPTDDPEATKAFYENLGFTRLVDGGIRGMLQCGTCVIEFYPRRKDEKPIGNIDHIAMTCENLEEAYDEIVKQGHTLISKGIESNEMFAPRTNRFFLFLGPSGEKIEFCKIS